MLGSPNTSCTGSIVHSFTAHSTISSAILNALSRLLPDHRIISEDLKIGRSPFPHVDRTPGVRLTSADSLTNSKGFSVFDSFANPWHSRSTKLVPRHRLNSDPRFKHLFVAQRPKVERHLSLSSKQKGVPRLVVILTEYFPLHTSKDYF